MHSKTTPRDRHRAYVATTPSRYLQPRKPRVARVMSAPVGAMPFAVSLRKLADETCTGGCGTIVCAKRGPCAPAAPKQPACDRCGARTAAHCTLCDVCAAEPPSARAEARDPYEAAGHPWARVGMRVRARNDGRERIVIPRPKNCDSFDMTGVVFAKPIDGDDREWTWAVNHYWEHLPAPTAEPESDAVQQCAALGIDLLEGVLYVDAYHGGTWLVGWPRRSVPSLQECARQALERYHVMKGGAR